MAKEIQIFKIKEQIHIGGLKIEVSDDITTELVKYDNGDIKVRYKHNSGNEFLSNPISKDFNKLIWQKAQQQQ